MSEVIFNDVLKLVELVKYDANGKKTTTKRNEFLVAITKKALNLDVGGNFIIDLQFKNDIEYYVNIENKANARTKPSNFISVGSLANLFQCCNFFIDDRQIFLYYNKNSQLSVVCKASKYKPSEFFITDKEVAIETYREVESVVSGDTIKVKIATRKNARYLNDKEIKLLKKYLDDADIMPLLTPKAIAIKNDKATQEKNLKKIGVA